MGEVFIGLFADDVEVLADGGGVAGGDFFLTSLKPDGCELGGYLGGYGGGEGGAFLGDVVNLSDDGVAIGLARGDLGGVES